MLHTARRIQPTYIEANHPLAGPHPAHQVEIPHNLRRYHKPVQPRMREVETRDVQDGLPLGRGLAEVLHDVDHIERLPVALCAHVDRRNRQLLMHEPRQPGLELFQRLHRVRHVQGPEHVRLGPRAHAMDAYFIESSRRKHILQLLRSGYLDEPPPPVGRGRERILNGARALELVPVRRQPGPVKLVRFELFVRSPTFLSVATTFVSAVVVEVRHPSGVQPTATAAAFALLSYASASGRSVFLHDRAT